MKCINSIFLLSALCYVRSLANERSLDTCPSGSIVDNTGVYCCPEGCERCGGYGCHEFPGGDVNCCTSKIKNPCTGGTAPCVLSESDMADDDSENSGDDDNSTCPADSIPDSSGTYCCPSSCGQCGGQGCHKFPGGEFDCCTSKIVMSCNDGVLPCITSEDSENNDGDDNEDTDGGYSCPSESISDDTGIFCCPETCGQCGGEGCHTFPGGDKMCCTSKIIWSCSEESAPCMISTDSDNTPVPSDAPTEYECAMGGILSKITNSFGCELEVCCPASCEVCDTSEECTEPPECCAATIIEPVLISDVDVSCRDHDPPCVVPPQDDPCAVNPCQNGARCGYMWNGWYQSETSFGCESRLNCECGELGDMYSGVYCELLCGEGEVPCGQENHGYSSAYAVVNDECCAPDQECYILEPKRGSYSFCLFIDRPLYCFSGNPCLNGGLCVTPNYVAECDCPEGYTGGFCQTPIE